MQHPELIDLLRNALCPLLVRNITEKSSSFPLSLRTIRIIYIFIRSYIDQLPDQCEVFLAYLVRVVAGDSEALAGVQGDKVGGGLAWFRAMVLEVFKT